MYNLPPHWKLIPADSEGYFWDDGRDYAKPMFLREDGKARFYYNEDPTIGFGIVFNDDGDCMDADATIEETIKYIDEVLLKD